MENVINVLDFQVANLIAAGEVVERPASAVKELVENSIDAGASHITVEIKNGGVSLMRVTDDGCGMSRGDAALCIKRHATSKIKNASDLNYIITLGFRGEALAAISSVAKVRILTKRREDETGTMIECDGGAALPPEDVGCTDGTTIIAEELFANVPARRKFLKKDAAETMAVTSAVEKAALGHPELSFKLICDGKLRFQTAGDGNLKSAVYSTMGREYASKLIAVRGESDGVEVNGYIGTPELIKKNRGGENFFINGRYIKSMTASSASEAAFQTYIPADKFPVCVLHLKIHPSLVDVNVHPSKLEVKFSNERVVFDAVFSAVRGALIHSITRPIFEINKDKNIEDSSQHLNTDEHSRISEKSGNGESSVGSFVSRLEGDEKKENLVNTLCNPPDRSAERLVNAFVPQPDRSEKIRPISRSLLDIDYEDPEIDNKPVFSAQVDREHFHGSDKNPEALNKEHISDISASDTASTGAKPDFCRDSVQKTNKYSEDRQDSVYTTEDSLLQYPYKVPPDGTAVPSSKEGNLHGKEFQNSCTSLGEGFSGKETTDLHAASDTLEKDRLEKRIENCDNADYTIIGVAANAYVFVELEDKVLVIDKHAAHERILFEKMKSNMYDGVSCSQVLLIPERVKLSDEEYTAAEEYRDEILRTGFSFELIDNECCAVITQVPAEFDNASASDMFSEILTRLSLGCGADVSRNNVYEKALFQASCKAAVKAGRTDDESHIKWIVSEVVNNPKIRYCPHGRPVAFEITKRDIEHRFKRI